ncbi:hypothetical protein [Pseudomonas sp.]|uniref:hypothetical protein n=1 Tax=Pseudomonas sp. TaxID=306 RepID=UPI003D0B40B7
MTEQATTSIWAELARGFRLIADECDCNARGDVDRVDNPGLAEECLIRLLDHLPPGPATEECVLALLGLVAAQMLKGAAEDAERNAAEAWTAVQAYREAVERDDDETCE